MARKRRGIGSLIRLTAVGLTLAAIVQELRKPPDEREWRGQVAGLVPYDFRPPTLQRIRESIWNRDSERLLTPQVFGVGWTLNLGRIVELLQRRI